MPRNEVVERMAKRLKEYREGLARTVFSHKEYPSADDAVLELLGIVEEGTYQQQIYIGVVSRRYGEDKRTCAKPELEEAFQLAREAREGKEKNGG